VAFIRRIVATAGRQQMDALVKNNMPDPSTELLAIFFFVTRHTTGTTFPLEHSFTIRALSKQTQLSVRMAGLGMSPLVENRLHQ